jgi:uncharacterized protein YgiB involved in biofilm formation
MMSAVPVLLTACGDSGQQPVIYQSVDNCVQAGELSYSECKQHFDEALAEHQKTAPRFDTKEACSAEWGDGQCQQTPTASGHGSFMPMLAGFMMARAFNNFGANRNVDMQNGSTSRATPLYRSGNNDTFRTASNQVVPGKIASANMVSRNGFGAASSQRSSYGG